MKRSLILHPFLFAIYSVLAPLSRNIAQAGIFAVRSLIITLAVVIGLTLLLRLVVRDQWRSSLLASLGIILFFLYGHVVNVLPKIISPVVVLALWAVLFIALAYWVLRKLRDAVPFSNYLNIVGVVLIIFPLYSIVTYTRDYSKVDNRISGLSQQLWQSSGVDDIQVNMPTPTSRLPDIYYIILDGYTRADVLDEMFAYDNAEFLRALEQRGFYVAPLSRSNYADTVYSIASALNMTHVTPFLEGMNQGEVVNDEEVLRDAISVLVQQNRAREFLAKQGYQFVTFDNGYARISIRTADHFEKSSEIRDFNPQSAFEVMLLDTTIWKAYLSLKGEDYVPLQSMFDDHRKRVLFTLTHLSKYAGQEQPVFVYAHVLSPHAPYVFGAQGEPRVGVDPFTLLDGVSTEPWKPEMYTDQVIYMNTLALQAIDEILAKSDPDPIIILQGDHSFRAYGDLLPDDEARMKLLFPILNAYHLPGALAALAAPAASASESLYPSITPVNSFRVVFNLYFGADLPLLDDASYELEKADGKLSFTDVCATHTICQVK
jgi:hypothetical protein